LSLLAAPVPLGLEFPKPVEDIEKLAQKVANDRLGQFGTSRLSEADREDLVTFLIGEAWRQHRRYDPSKDRNPNFTAYIARILSFRCADWYRERFGDSRHGGHELPLSLDAPAGAAPDGDGEAGGHRLLETLAASAGDPTDDRSTDLLGALQRGGRARARPQRPLRQQAARRAPRRDAQPRRPLKPAAAGHDPICQHCARLFLAGFRRANQARKPAERRPDRELQILAQQRARAVKVAKDEYACPRCTSLPSSDRQQRFLDKVYPGRAARRRAREKAEGDSERTEDT
jgi:DNA-directed RNA polymerase specialized sigma24 family protein